MLKKLRMVAPPFPWFGGKARLRKQIVPLLPPHEVYVEPFAGAASVFFGKAKSDREVLNDINGELVRFYRVLQHHPGTLLDEMAELHFGREEFRRLRDADLASLTDVQRAARFLYLQRASYAALPGRPHFAPMGNKAYNLIRRTYERALEETHERLRDAVIENLPWQEAIRRWDGPTTLFYVDPPYIQCKGYGFPFGDDDHRELAKVLKAVRGVFVLSLNDHPLARELYVGCRIRQLIHYYATTTRYTHKQTPVGELLIFGGRAYPGSPEPPRNRGGHPPEQIPCPSP